MLSIAGDKRTMTKPVPDPAPIIKDMRERIFALNSAEVGISPSSEHPNIWGVLMETGYPEALATLVSLADGTTSLYLGHGGGIIGGGEHDSVRRATMAFISDAERYIDKLTSTKTYPLPDVGRVKFYVLTFNGILTADVEENDLGEGRHELSKLFFTGHKVLTELRHIDEQREKHNKSLE